MKAIEITEVWISEETGIPREVLRSLREKKLVAADWEKGSRGRVVWKIQALERCTEDFPVLEELIKKIKGGRNGTEKLLSEFEEREVTVTRKFANRRLIEAEDASGGKLRVRVRENKNFTRGMCISVLPPKVKNQPWRLVGRAPRWPGRF